MNRRDEVIVKIKKYIRVGVKLGETPDDGAYLLKADVIDEAIEGEYADEIMHIFPEALPIPTEEAEEVRNKVLSLDFGVYVRRVRLEAKLLLRDFCRQVDIDPSNWSKVERGLLRPPKDKLERIVQVLLPGEKQQFYKLAAQTFVPDEIKDAIGK